MKPSTQKALMQGFAQRTQVVQKGTGQYRRWPSGVGITILTRKSIRPELTPDQKLLMHPADVEAYYVGKRSVDVPMLDDPF